MKTSKEFVYRPDIDGLRALAVLVVLFYHADFGFSGGYVGVDVFFVISGYLITSLIIKDLENKTFTFKQFWARRIRRIFPPLLVVILTSVFVGCFVLMPSDLSSLGKAISSQSIFAANVHYWLDSGYFTGNAEEKPLLHTWSLAVEEQFYLIAPAFLWIMYKNKIPRQKVLWLITIVFGISFAISVFGVTRSPSASFYLLPTRAWEIGMGSILAFLPSLDIRRILREIISVIGFSLILLPVFLYTESTLFPGIAALPPCLGTAMLIYANKSSTFLSSVLSVRPVVFIGLISYSLYLWHWIFLAFYKYKSIHSPSFEARIGMVLLSFLFAYLSWRLVETPFRNKRIAKANSSIFRFGGIGFIIVFVTGAVCVISNGFPQRFSPDKLNYAQATQDLGIISELGTEDIKQDNLLVIGEEKAPLNLLVWGDSHAMSALTAFDKYLKEKRLSGRAATHSATLPILEWYGSNPAGLVGKESVEWNAEILKYVERHKVKNVVLVAYWGDRTKDPQITDKIFLTVKAIQEKNAKVWILLDPPIPNFNVPKTLSRNDYSIDYLNRFFVSTNFDEEFVSKLKNAGVNILDPKPRFLNAAGFYIVELDGVTLYRDEHHLSKSGAEKILLPFLIDNLSIE